MGSHRMTGPTPIWPIPIATDADRLAPAVLTSGPKNLGIRELEREAERNGYYLSVDLDFREMKKDYMCRNMTPEEWAATKADISKTTDQEIKDLGGTIE